jgi:hypothetical protein
MILMLASAPASAAPLRQLRGNRIPLRLDRPGIRGDRGRIRPVIRVQTRGLLG